jgi:hypothetical protein
MAGVRDRLDRRPRHVPALKLEKVSLSDASQSRAPLALERHLTAGQHVTVVRCRGERVPSSIGDDLLARKAAPSINEGGLARRSSRYQ